MPRTKNEVLDWAISLLDQTAETVSEDAEKSFGECIAELTNLKGSYAMVGECPKCHAKQVRLIPANEEDFVVGMFDDRPVHRHICLRCIR